MVPDLRPLPPKDAIAFFRSKGMRIGFAYQDVWQEEHAYDFTVAKATSIDILEDIRGALDRAQEMGLPYDTFRRQLAPVLQAKGWWGRKDMVDPLTGQTVKAQLGSNRRLRTIFDTNLRQAYHQGNWQRAWAVRADLPYMVYQHNDVRFPRPEHEAWDGVCLPIVHPWWRTHYPQCAWGCKCSTWSASASMLSARGIKVTADKDIPRFPVSEFVNSRTGEVDQVEQGIDPAFNFNVGLAPLRPVTARPEQVDGNRPVKDIDAVTKPFFDGAGVSPDAREPLLDKGGWPVAVNRLLFEDASGKAALPSADTASLGDAGRTLKAPDAVSWHWKSELTKAADRAAVAQVLHAEATERDPRLVARLGPVEPWLVKLAGEEGTDLRHARHEIDAGHVRHMFSRHGPDAPATRAGGIAVTADDIAALPALVRRPDAVITGFLDDDGQPAMAFVRTGAKGVLVYVVRVGKWRVRSVTAFWRPAGTDLDALRRQLRPNALDGGGDPRKLSDLTGKINPSRDQLVRRYTKRIDKRTVTVDFSGGTWTYEVRPEDALKTP